MRLSGETIRRGLARLGWVWRRPRPEVGPTDPQYDQKLQAIRDLLAALPENETAMFQDEVDVHLNPKIGSCWMQRGQQAEVVTPGNNEKRHVAGSLHWRTGTLLVSPPGKRRNTELFLEHLDDLRRSVRSYRKIHVICDNAAFHQSRAVKQYLARWRDRIEIHFLQIGRQASCQVGQRLEQGQERLVATAYVVRHSVPDLRADVRSRFVRGDAVLQRAVPANRPGTLAPRELFRTGRTDRRGPGSTGPSAFDSLPCR